ncbi:Potassium voltage-gated channel sub H member 7 [Chytriomyces hyalinus]|nr:Potassium voltage-gated channel sub H member 7 [Chytriomyces hyalinus]
MGFDASGRLYKQKMDELKEYFRWKDLDDVTQRKIIKYYDVKYRGKFFEEETLLKDLNDPLRKEIALHNCKKMISNVKFLRRDAGDGRDELFIGRIALALKSCYYVTGDIIIHQGGSDHDMYFIMKGRCNVFVDGKKIRILNEGSFFGELALMGQISRTATVQAVSSCEIYRLSRNDFVEIISDFEDMQLKTNEIYSHKIGSYTAEEAARSSKLALEDDLRRRTSAMGSFFQAPSLTPSLTNSMLDAVRAASRAHEMQT